MVENFGQSVVVAFEAIVGSHEVIFFGTFAMMNVPTVDERR